MAEHISKIVSLVRDGVIRKSYKTVHYLDENGEAMQSPRDVELTDAERNALFGEAHVAAQSALDKAEQDLRAANEELLGLRDIAASRATQLEAARARIAELEAAAKAAPAE